MTTIPTEEPAQDDQPRPGGPGDLGGLRRSATDRHIAGVAGGLARHFDIDPIIVRVTLVVLVFFGGAGLALYGGIWLLVPQEDEREAMIRLDDRSRSFLLYVVGGVAALMLLGDSLGHVHVPWPLLGIALILIVVIGGHARLQIPRRQRPDEVTETHPTSPYADYSERLTEQAHARVQARLDARAAARTARLAPDPRRRGPILFWFTLALIALAEGALGLVDLAGAAIPGPSYAALAVGVIGLKLVLGAFWGRAGGLIVLGLVASLVLAGSLAANKWQFDGHGRSITYTPTSSGAVVDDYRLGTGDLTVDLSQIADPAALAGRSIEVAGHVGSIKVIVPPQIAVFAEADIRGPGQVQIFGEGHGGFHTHSSGGLAGPTGAGAGEMTIDAHLNVGKITVETSNE